MRKNTLYSAKETFLQRLSSPKQEFILMPFSSTALLIKRLQTEWNIPEENYVSADKWNQKFKKFVFHVVILRV